MIASWSSGTAGGHMPEPILTELSGVIGRHPWWRARTALIGTLLGRLNVAPDARVLDAGCGWGVTLQNLEGRGYRAVGLDVARQALERLDRPGRLLVEADLTRELPAGRIEPFDAVLALDVLEHLDDDRAAVRRLASLARPGGVVIASVPALPELYGEFDAIQGHRRRYLPETLRAAFDRSGLEVESVFWWGSWMVPLMRRRQARRLAQPGEPAEATYRRHLRLPPRPLRWALDLAFALEKGRALDGRLRRGTSLFAVARRPACPILATVA